MRLSKFKFIILGLSLSTYTLAQTQPTYPNWWFAQKAVGENAPAAPGESGHDPVVWQAWIDATQPPLFGSPEFDDWMADNYKIALLGQAKHMTESAMQALEDAEAGSAGSTITNMVVGFSTAPDDNYVPLNIGQLKYLAQPFYDRMHFLDYPIVLEDGTIIPQGQYPWSVSTPLETNYEPANLGQLKYIFSFDLTVWPPGGDADGDGLLDNFENKILNDPKTDFYDPDGLITSITDILAGDDYDGDGYTNLQEWQNGTDPADFFNGETPVLTIHSGDNQIAAQNEWLPQQLYVKVRDTEGQNYANAPVKFSVVGGHSGLAQNKSIGTPASTLMLRAATYGARVCFTNPDMASGDPDIITTVTATLPTGQSVSFNDLTAQYGFSVASPYNGVLAPGKPVLEESPDLTSITITWADNSDNETAFNIERSEGNGIYQVVHTVGPNITSWTDTGLDPNRAYFYRIVSL